MLALSTSESYLFSGCDNKVIRKAICIFLKQAAEHRNPVLTSFVVEAKKHNPGVGISFAIDFSSEVLVIRNQNAFLLVCPAKNLGIFNAWCIVVH